MGQINREWRLNAPIGYDGRPVELHHLLQS